jgi:hypothetical protein
MMKNRLALAAALALAAPSGGGAVAVQRRDDYGPFTGWMRASGRGRPSEKVIRRSISALQLQAWATPPCDAPKGYLWHLAASGRGYYLLKAPPGERKVVYDAVNDRSIIYSGWGYVKPTYVHGDAR